MRNLGILDLHLLRIKELEDRCDQVERFLRRYSHLDAEDLLDELNYLVDEIEREEKRMMETLERYAKSINIYDL